MDTLQSELQFSPESLKEVDRIIQQFPEGKHKSAILRLLHMAQHEFGGWLSVDAMDYVARLLHINPIEVYEVATFYSMYNMEKVGKVVLEVCHTGPCCLVGAERIISHIEKSLNILPGQTTPDGVFTLKTVECLGACGYAPMLQIGETYYEHLTEEKVDVLLKEFRTKNS